MKYSVYTLTFTNGATYVGSTRDLARRLENHLNRLRSNKHAANLQSLFAVHGEPALKEVANAFNLTDLHILETQVMDNTTSCINVCQPEPHEPSCGDSYGPYTSKAEAARELGCAYRTIKRKSKELTYPEFVNWLDSTKAKQPQCLYPPDPRTNNSLIFNKGWFRRQDVSVVPLKTAKKRRENGWSDWDSLVTPYGQPNPQLIKRVSASSVCRRYGVNPAAYYVRRQYGWTVLEALELRQRTCEQRKPKVKQRMITADGKTMPLNVWAKKLGVTPGVIHGRIHSGWSDEAAVTTPKRVQTERADKQPRKPREIRLITVQGFTGTIREVAEHFGMPEARLRSRLSAGWHESNLTRVPG